MNLRIENRKAIGDVSNEEHVAFPEGIEIKKNAFTEYSYLKNNPIPILFLVLLFPKKFKRFNNLSKKLSAY